MKNNSTKKDIAVIGISCKFSNSNSPKEFWNNLKEGTNLLELYTDEELLQMGVEQSTIEDPNYIKLNSHVNGTDSFDYAFFGYTKEEANLMDPQIRLLHEQTWLALEDAGCDPLSYKKKIGLYLAASENLNWMAHGMMNPNPNVDSFYASHIMNRSNISTLISYKLNLQGPSAIVDTACSSSLFAVHMACRSLLMRECTVAMAGGVKLNTEKNTSYFFQEGMIGSKDGRCRTFDEDCSGTFEGQGGGMVVLKRLEDAINDRDHIYGVIKASAANNDGQRKVGYTAPSVAGQYDCIKQALNFSKIPTESISYVEAHGTGTRLGDPIEVNTLNKVFDHNTEHKCAIGSVKTNLGHLDTAAGVAGLIKTSLALEHKMIPPTLHFETPNPEINFDKGPFYVNSEVQRWSAGDEYPLRAGINSLGIGGTNVHVIMEEAPAVEKGSDSRLYQLLPYSGKTANAVKNYNDKLTQFIEQSTDELSDIAYTLKTGRRTFKYRDFVVASSSEDASGTLIERKEQEGNRLKEDLNASVVFMFPGQGSQYFEMARDIYNQEPFFKEIMDRGLESLNKLTGEDYAAVLGYSVDDQVDPNRINNTLYTQPLLFLVEYALAKMMMQWGVQPSAMIGHSLGEYTAACVAGVFTLEEGLKLLSKRAQLMSDLEKGSMLAVGISAEEVTAILPDGLSIAGINTASSCVVSGRDELIERFVRLLESKEIAFSKLKTSHAFHSEMMDEMLEEYTKELEQIHLLAPRIPFISNISGKEISEENATSPAYWTKHLRETVKFQAGIGSLLTRGNTVFIEIGPGTVLSTFCKQHQAYSKFNNTINLLRHPRESDNDNKKLTTALGELWATGVDINWESYYADEVRNTISIPTYCFDSYPLNFKVEPFQELANSSMTKDGVKPFDQWFYIPNWKKSVVQKTEINSDEPLTYLVFSENTKISTPLINQLKANGNTVITVDKNASYKVENQTNYKINPKNKEDFFSLFSNLEANGIVVDQVIYNWNFEGSEQEEMVSAFMVLQALCESLLKHYPDNKKKITVLNECNEAILGYEKMNVGMLTTVKILDICAQENPIIFSSTIDISEENNFESTSFLSAIIDELKFNFQDRKVAYRHGSRWTEFFENLAVDLSEELQADYLKQDKVYIITGGMGVVGKVLAKHLCSKYNATVILMGRSEIPMEVDWNFYLNDEDTNEGMVNRINQLKELRNSNPNIFYASADVSDYDAFSKAIQQIEETYGSIAGVIHAAGNIQGETYKPVENLTSEIAVQQFDPKINGTINVYEVFKNHNLDFVWITSSLSTILGGLTYGAYVVANSFVDKFVTDKRDELKNWFVVNLDGIAKQRVSHDKLITVLENSFKIGDLPQVIVSAKDPNEMLKIQLAPQVEEEITEAEAIERPTVKSNYVPAKSQYEIEITEIWKAFFGYSEIGITDNFFELGGDSLKAMTLLKQMHKSHGFEMSIEDFFKNPNIKALSDKIEIMLNLKSLQNKKQKSTSITI